MSGLLQAVRLPDEAATTALGAALAQAFGPSPRGVVTLGGGLGAGKTHLVRSWLRALGVAGAIRSPTYTLVEPYDLGGSRVLHMDLYRLQAPEEWEGLGLADDPPDQHLWLIEWPGRAEGFLPVPRLHLELALEGVGRRGRLEWAQDDDPAALVMSSYLKKGS